MGPQLRFNPTTNEPFLPILHNPNTDKHIIFTPYRTTDKPAIIAGRNHPLIAKWLPTSAPFPYTSEAADHWLTLNHDKTQRALEHLKEIENGQRKWMGECPVGAIREVRFGKDGAEVESLFLGDVGLFRYRYHWVVDEVEKDRIAEKNFHREAGDEEILWEIGDWLVASHHGRGIMTAAVKVFVEWVVANMNVHHIKAHILPENIGSCRVFEKNGFVQVIRSQDELAILETEDGADSKKLDKSLLFEWTRNKN